MQWFVGLDDPKTDVRGRALEAIKGVQWVPAWGEARIAGMVENRHEWVISRQRKWGSPITLLYAVRDGERAEVYPWRDDPAEQRRFFDHVAGIFRAEGGDAWFARPAEDFLPEGASRRGFASFEKETDILDVWFDSGVSHQAVLRHGEWPELAPRPGDPGPPADLYLEGHDQHRGWFQSSLLTSVALFGQAPYRAVVTHGFFLDAERSKMSKSLGNVIDPQDLIARYGADVLRLWVSSLDYRDDMPISEEILARCAEAYRKVRNTARYLVSNLYDFDPARDSVPADGLEPLDRWALAGARAAATRMAEAFAQYDFHLVYHALVNLSATTLSAFYLDIVKDRLYASLPDSRERRSAQTALLPDRPGARDPLRPDPALHVRGDLEGAARTEGRIRPPRAFRDAGRPAGGRPLAQGLGTIDAAARRGLRDPRGSPPREADRILARGGRPPDRKRRARGGPGGDRRRRLRPGRPLHRFRGVRSRDGRRGRLARFPRLPGAPPPVPEGLGPPLRPLLEGDTGGGRSGPLPALPRRPGRPARRDGGGRPMIGGIKLKESTIYRAGYLAVSLAVLLLDQWTKGIVTRAFDVHQSRTLVAGLFDITYVRNSGAAFGLFASVDSSIKAILLNSVAVLVFLVVSAYALRSSHRSVRLQLGFALILGGAVGNLLDRVRFGYVVDFLDFSISGHHWPAFNVADSAICIGVGLLFLDMLRNEGEEAAAAPPRAGS